MDIIRPYIAVGDYVVAETHGFGANNRTEEGVVVLDDEGFMRIAKAADADPYGPDGLPVQADWVGIISHKKAGN